MKRLIPCLVGFLLTVASSKIGRADELPLWEAGLGAAVLSLPDYRGSDQQRMYVLPLPYLVYRGDYLRLDSKGLTGLLFRSERVQLKISGEAAMPSDSSRNTARAGMPDLDLTVQVGPALEISLYKDANAKRVLLLRLPVRAAIATDLSRWEGIGSVFNPQFTLDLKDIGPGKGWDLRLAAGTYFASERYHDYFYEVAPQFAVAGSRPAYDARAGYSGSFLMVTATKRFRRMWLGAFVSYDGLSGAVFADSPLTTTEHCFMAGLGVSWVFAESKTLVQLSP
jgi:outer membrane scaffolding protein for murein synthesis (MipA/OmpV family)